MRCSHWTSADLARQDCIGASFQFGGNLAVWSVDLNEHVIANALVDDDAFHMDE
jgi:hypothetical protein